jgi:hypothetical protein
VHLHCLDPRCFFVGFVQVPSHLIILKDATIDDTMKTAAEAAVFWLSNDSKQIKEGVTSLWSKRTTFQPIKPKQKPMRLAAPPGALIAVVA